MRVAIIIAAILVSFSASSQVSIVRAIKAHVTDTIISKGVIYTDKENAHAIILRPSNYGVSYPGYGVAGDFRIGWDNSYINPESGRPDVVGTMWGYNTLVGGGRINSSEAAFSFRTETHYETGGQQLFEFHMPAFIGTDGVSRRLMSWYLPKSGTAGSGGPRLETTEFQLMKWGDQNTPWMTMTSGRLRMFVYEKATTNFPELLFGSLADSINGTILLAPRFYSHIRSTGNGMNIGLDDNSVSLGNDAIRTEFPDNVWIGQQAGSGGTSSTQRNLLVGGRVIVQNSSNGNALDVDKTGGTGDVFRFKSSGSTIINGTSTYFSVATGKFSWLSNLHLNGSAVTTTTNATTTTVHTLATTSNTAGILEVWVVGKLTATNEFITGKKIMRYKNVGGTLTIGTPTAILADEIDTGLAGATWTVTASGASLLVRVTGLASTTIQWTPQVQVVTSNNGGL